MVNRDKNRIEVFVDVFEEKGQRALVLHNLSVANLMQEIAGEFDGIEPDEIERYVLIDKETRRVLKPEQSLVAQDIQPGDALDFVYKPRLSGVAPVNRRRQTQSSATLILEGDGEPQRFEIRDQPAIIGRRDPSMPADALAVDLADLTYARMLSRRHAQLTETGGVWSISRLKEKSKVYVDGDLISFGEQRELKDGVLIELGPKVVQLVFSSTSESP